MEFKKLEEINKRLRTTDIKGKNYVEVNQRILAFRELFENGSIETEIVELQNGICTIKAIARDENYKVISTGYAQEKEGSTFINKTSYIENCETSAIGRALGTLGIGATTSIASAEEVLNAINNQEKQYINMAQKKLLKTKLENRTTEQLNSIKEICLKYNANSSDEILAKDFNNILKEIENI